MSHSKTVGYNKANTSDEHIIMGIKNHHDKVIEKVYKEYHQRIRTMVFTFRNTKLDPDDIFQEGLTRAILNIREGRFRGESSFLTYLNGICRNICLKELSHQQNEPIGIRDFSVENEGTDFEALEKLVKIRERMEEKCRTIIDLRFGLGENESSKGASFDEIAVSLDLTPENARQRFKRCMDKLREFVNKDIELKNYYNQ